MPTSPRTRGLHGRQEGLSPARSGRAALILAVLFVLALAVAVGIWLQVRSEPSSPTRDQVAREMAAAWFERDDRVAAREALRPLVERERPAAQDLVSLGLIDWETGDLEAARRRFEGALAVDPDCASAHYNLGHYYAQQAGDPRSALKHFERAHELAPDDLPAQLALAIELEDVDPARAETMYAAIVDLGPDLATIWYMVASYRLGQVWIRSDRMDQARELYAVREQLVDRGLSSPNTEQQRRGNLGRIPRPAPRGIVPRGPGPLPQLGPVLEPASGFGRVQGLAVHDLDDDDLSEVLFWGEGGIAFLHRNALETWASFQVLDEPAVALAFDLGNDDDMDLLWVPAGGGQLHLLEAQELGSGPSGAIVWEGGGLQWTDWAATGELRSLPATPGPVRDLQAVDYDHDGDLDLLLVGDFGALLLRNDGAAVPAPLPVAGQPRPQVGTFTDVTEEASLPRGRAFAWCAIEDIDIDQDVDLLLGGPDGNYLASNLRGGRFEDASDWLGDLKGLENEPVLADLDGDARPDLLGNGFLLLGQPSGRFRRTSAEFVPGDPRMRAADLDLDGSLDAYWDQGSHADGLEHLVRVRLCSGLPEEQEAEFRLNVLDNGRMQTLFDDLDGDLAFDAIVASGDGVELQLGSQPGTNAVRLGYRGRKDNRRGIGATVQLRAGTIYRRIFWGGQPMLVGLGDETQTDWVAVRWPNGVLSYDVRRELGDRNRTRDAESFMQPDGLQGSCPFLYAWNGEQYEFISDVLGITPLGLPIAPGQFVPPDHDEYVLVRGEQLQPRDGFLELQFTEELREVTYLDRIYLQAIDHPADTEVYPNELFCFPPFPEPHTHTVKGPLSPLRASDGDERDWTAALASIDDEYAVPFELPPSQFQGLATPHFLELEFDAAALASAPRLRLLMTGWFFWTDASVNMASARHPEQSFVPPMIQVPDGQGGWRPTGPPVGFPAGKTKTMVIDVTDLLDREDPRLRVFSTLRLYWDSIRLAVDGDDTPTEVSSIEAASAKLWRRGFSEPVHDDEHHRPERFDWHRLAAIPRWNPHPGQYTRLGDVLPLLGEIDDRYVIMASGDALEVRFDATALPALREGWRRDYLVFLDGWAKDRDPNTVEALHVEPLPHHGMSGYPYGPEEPFPDGPEHRAWRAEWNTRTEQPWIPIKAVSPAELQAAANDS